MSRADGGLDPARPNLLISYAYARPSPKVMDMTLALADVVPMLIDSGAFTNYQERRKAAIGGKRASPITIGEYVEACRRFDGRVWEYIQLDEIRDPPGTARNLDLMLQAGLKPMPVFVMGERYERVPELVATNERICVAGGQRGTTAAQARYQKAYAASGNRARIHALGFTRFPLVWQLPLASGDSSTFAAGSRYGTVMVYDPRRGLRQVPFKEIVAAGSRHPDYEATVGFLRRCNVRADQIRDPALLAGTYGLAAKAAVFATLQFHRACVERGFRFFFAITGAHWTAVIAAVALARNGPTSFDYPAAIRIQRELVSAWKEDANRCIDRLQRAFGGMG